MDQKKGENDALFKKLLNAINNDDSKAILESCNTILQIIPDDIDAQKSRIICYINMGKYEDAIRVIESSAHDFYNEHVYCMYMIQRYEEALEMLSRRENADPKMMLLKAQILYRLERYDESLEMYRSSIHSEAYDYLTNVSAASIMSHHLTEGSQLLEKYKTSNSYEVLYNYGTLLIYLGRLEEAEAALLQSLSIGRKQGNEEEEFQLQEEDVYDALEELDPIRVQLGYIYMCKGEKARAERLLNVVLRHTTSSKVVMTIALNNAIALQECSNPLESMKRMKSISSEVVEKLTREQQAAIRFNSALLLLLLNRKKDFEAALSEMGGSEEVSAALLRSCELCVKNREAEALEQVETKLAIYPHSTDLLLLKLQILVNQERFEEALQAILAFPTALLQSRAVQTLFYSICRHVENKEAVNQLVDSMGAESTSVSCVEYYYQEKRYEEVITKLTTLLQTSLSADQRLQLTSQLVLALSYTRPEEAIQMSSQLPEVEIVEDLDINELEEKLKKRDFVKKSAPAPENILNTISTPREMEEEESVMENVRKIAAEKKKKQNKKKRVKKTLAFINELKAKGKYVDPSKLDKERWLAKEDRTAMKKKKKNTASITGVGAQGDHVTQAEMDKYDAKKRAEAAPAQTPQFKPMVSKSGMRRKKVGKKSHK